MDLEFTGTVIEWRGPSPYYFVPVPAEESAEINEVAAMATYGWGVIPVAARVGGGTVLFAAYGRITVSCRPKAALVALMDRWMYGASLSARLGWTVKFCTASG